MKPLRIYLFGGFLLERGDRPLPPIPSRLGRSLFAYLVVHRDRGHTRDLLAGMFWPEMPEARARRRLSHTLWQIQTVLAEDDGAEPYIVSDADSLRFNIDAPYWVDVEEFGQRLSALDTTDAESDSIRELEELRTAVSLYRGDFLAGFYDGWELVDQEHLRELHFNALGRLVRLCKSRADYEEALVYARRIVGHDPLREEAHREVMRLCALLGRTNEALQEFQRTVSILNEELGAQPAPATVALFREISEMREKGARPFTPAPRSPLLEVSRPIPLVGRDDERAAVIGLMEETLAEGGGTLLLEGDAGVGKSRLLQELAEDAHWRGLSVLWGECWEEESARPYEVLRSALESGLSQLRAEQLSQTVDGVWLRQVSRVAPALAEWLPDLPPGAPLKAQEEPTRMREALLRTLLALGQISPHVVFLDDVQWADQDTLQALVHIAQNLPGGRVLLVISYRGEDIRRHPEAWEALRSIDQMVGSDRLSLVGLTREETDELVNRSMGWTGSQTQLTEGLFYETGGNPFFVLETLRALHEQQAYTSEQAERSLLGAENERLPLADSVTHVIGRRLDAVPPATRDVIRATAVDQRLLMAEGSPALKRWSRTDVLEGIDDALRRGLLIERDGDLRFSHDLVRRVVYRQIAPQRRRALHRFAAAVIAASAPEAVELLAHHYSQARVWDLAVRYLRMTGQRAVEVHAYETAARHYERAMAAADEADIPASERFDLFTEYAETLDVLGHRDRQEEVIDRLVDLAGTDPERTAAALRRRAWLYAQTDRFEQAEDAARASLVAADAANAPFERAGALTVLGLSLSWSGHPADGVPYLRKAADAYASSPARQADAFYALGNVLGEIQEYEKARLRLETALARYVELQNRRGEAEALSVLGTIHYELGDAATAEDRYARARQACQAIGYRHGEAVNLANLGSMLMFHDRVGEALELYAEAADAFSFIGNQRGEAMVRANTAAVRYIILGDDEGAGSEARTALLYFDEVGNLRGQAQCNATLGTVAGRSGDMVNCRKHLELALDQGRGAKDRWVEVHVIRQLSVMELQSGEPMSALERIGEAQAMAEDLGMADVAVTVEALRARILLAVGRKTEAFQVARSAASKLHSRIEQAYLVSFALYETASALGRGEEAQSALRQAYELLERTMSSLSDHQRRHSLGHVPEHRAIVQAWTRGQPTIRTCRLPTTSSPIGRPLRDDEWVEVRWTVAEPADDAIADGILRRRTQLVRLVREATEQGGAPTVGDLAVALKSSEATIRRDISALRVSGVEVPTRGSRRTSSL